MCALGRKTSKSQLAGVYSVTSGLPRSVGNSGLAGELELFRLRLPDRTRSWQCGIR